MPSPSMKLAIPAPVLEQLEEHGLSVGVVLDRVEDRLREQVTSSYAFVDEAAKYLMDAGGKRFRPLLVALAAQLGNPDSPDIADAGVVVELVHLATLYHDDVIDEARARRGAESANHRWDNTIATLTGDYLFARASELSADLGVEVTRLMARTIATLCEGEIREVQGSKGALPPEVPRLDPTREHYLTVISEKTASLIATSCRLGGLLAGLQPDEVESLTTYGWNVGMAFQLSDDILDIASEETESGKIPGTDLREGVLTLPMLEAIDADPDGEIAQLLGRDDELNDEEVARGLALLRDPALLDRAREVSASYVDEAIAALTPFPEDAPRKALTRLAEYALARTA